MATHQEPFACRKDHCDKRFAFPQKVMINHGVTVVSHWENAWPEDLYEANIWSDGRIRIYRGFRTPIVDDNAVCPELVYIHAERARFESYTVLWEKRLKMQSQRAGRSMGVSPKKDSA